MSERPKNTVTGYNKEKAVVTWLERHGFEILYEGGRGPADIIATDGGRRWLIQVKYTRSMEMGLERFDKERGPLIRAANKHGGTAVLCVVVQNSLWFISAKTEETLARGFL
jgi:Holliday junction resolvase